MLTPRAALAREKPRRILRELLRAAAAAHIVGLPLVGRLEALGADRAAFFDLFLLSRFLLLKTSTSLCFFPQAKHLIDADGNVKA